MKDQIKPTEDSFSDPRRFGVRITVLDQVSVKNVEIEIPSSMD